MEKKFNKPELTVIQFASDDIIVTSGKFGDGWGGAQVGDFWGDPADPDIDNN